MEAGRQFAGMPSTVSSVLHPMTQVTPVTPSHQHSHVHMSDSGDRPLSLGSSTFGSVNAASAWRKPSGRVLPYSAATAGSTFKPYGE